MLNSVSDKQQYFVVTRRRQRHRLVRNQTDLEPVELVDAEINMFEL